MFSFKASATYLIPGLVCSAFLISRPPESVAIERTYTADGDVKVIRLPVGASANGWVGRRRRPPKTAPTVGFGGSDSQRLNSRNSFFVKPTLQIRPPKALPTEPGLLKKSQTPQKSESANEETNVGPELKEESQTNNNVTTARYEVRSSRKVVRLISQTVVTTAQTPVIPTAENNDNTSAETQPPARPSQVEPTKNNPDADEKSILPLTLSELEISRPLSGISLSSSLNATSLNGSDLRKPENQASTMFATRGVYLDRPVVQPWGDGQGMSCEYPICFNPLYFEDPNMERCGQGFGCFTEFAAMAHFFGRIPILPYLKGSNPHWECVRSLGYCPSCHQYGFHAYIPPLNLPGVIAQAAAMVEVAYLIP